MIYNLAVWFEDENISTEPILMNTITLDETLDEETLNVISSNLRVAFEIMFNKRIEIEFEEKANSLSEMRRLAVQYGGIF